MRMTYASYMQFLWRCWHEQDMEHLATMAEWKGCHDGETKMVPRQHIVSGNSRTYRCKRSGREHVMQDGGVIPNSGFPRDGGMAKEGHRKDNSITVQNSSISYNQACIRSRAVVISGLYLWSVDFGAVRVRYDVEEVDILGTVVVEVVVHKASWEVVVHISQSFTSAVVVLVSS